MTDIDYGVFPLAFLDTETTGLRPDIHTIWEIAWTTADHTEDGRLIRRKSRSMTVKLTGDELAAADPAALRIGRFAERWSARTAVSRWDAMMFLQQDLANIRLGGKNPHLVGAVPSFDHAMLCSNWFGWPGYGEGLWHYHLIDVEALAVGHLSGWLDADDDRLPVNLPWNSDDLSRMFGVEPPTTERHTAAGDVDWALRLYAAIHRLEVVG